MYSHTFSPAENPKPPALLASRDGWLLFSPALLVTVPRKTPSEVQVQVHVYPAAPRHTVQFMFIPRPTTAAPVSTSEERRAASLSIRERNSAA